jgi:hydroxypyruvate reductase
MSRFPAQLRRDALDIWHAGLAAVDSERLVAAALRVEGDELIVGPLRLRLDRLGRILVVGAGKAGAGMAAAVEAALGPRMEQHRLAGLVSVPADCLRPLRRITLSAARPAGCNEPTPEGVAAAEAILRAVAALRAEDLCLCLISGGGSALLPAPEGITLEDKLALTRHLSAAGADIVELNTVRKQLSRIKGGGLARACRAGRLVALIISDVAGDPLELIASGPTVPDDASTPQAALAVLEKFPAPAAAFFPRVVQYLRQKDAAARPPQPGCQVTNLVIGNNATAVEAAGARAQSLGYCHVMLCARGPEGTAEEVGRHLADMALQMRARPGPNCLISGGEPAVRLVEPSRRGRGGRNQQLVLAALVRLAAAGAERLALLSGGTDGEDGPTDAAGALLDAAVLAAARRSGLDGADFLARNDAYRFFAPLDALIKTGPTHTNVGDLRVVVVAETAERHLPSPPAAAGGK